MENQLTPYVYKCTLNRIIDGDTIVVNMDMGFDITIVKDVRLAHINAPEHNKPGGKEATEHLTELLGTGTLYLKTYKPFDKYGRYLADIYTSTDASSTTINQMMINDGFAVAYEGGAR